MRRLQGLLETSPLTKAALWGLATVGMVGGGLALTEDETQASGGFCDCFSNNECTGFQEQCVSVTCTAPEAHPEYWGKCQFVC
jgi:hypothetical protein